MNARRTSATLPHFLLFFHTTIWLLFARNACPCPWQMLNRKNAIASTHSLHLSLSDEWCTQNIVERRKWVKCTKCTRRTYEFLSLQHIGSVKRTEDSVRITHFFVFGEEKRGDNSSTPPRIDLIHWILLLLLLPFLSSSALKCLFFMVQVSIFFFLETNEKYQKTTKSRKDMHAGVSVCSLVPVPLRLLRFSSALLFSPSLFPSLSPSLLTSSSKLIIG